MREHSRRGFTLAELLVAVAIIGVLVAVSIPIFTSQLDKAKISANAANIKAAQNDAIYDYFYNDRKQSYWKEIAGSNSSKKCNYCYSISSGTFVSADNQDYYKESNGIYDYIHVYFDESSGELVIKTSPCYDSSKTKLSEAIKKEAGTNKF